MNVMLDNRTDAGRQLAARLLDLRDRPATIVLGLPRGGVPVAAEVANAINAPLDVLLVRKLGTPGRPELAMGAIASGDQLMLDDDIITAFQVTDEQIRQTIADEQAMLQSRENRYRGGRPLPDLVGKTVVIIDDGLATGSTMRVAIQAVKQQSPGQIIVGVPVGSPDRVKMIGREVDRIECLHSPAGFQAVGQWYHDFRPTSDEDVTALLNHG